MITQIQNTTHSPVLRDYYNFYVDSFDYFVEKM